MMIKNFKIANSSSGSLGKPLRFFNMNILLLLIILLLPATRFQFFQTPITIGNILLLVFIIFAMSSKLRMNVTSQIFFWTWIGIFLCLLVGFIVHCVLVHKINLYFFHDLLAYGLVFLFLIALSDIRVDVNIVLQWVVILFPLLYFLFMFDLGSWYNSGNTYKRYSGLSHNPNQFALYLLPLPFLALYYLKDAQKFYRCLFIFSITITVYLGMLSQCHALLVAWIAALSGYTLYCIFSFFKKINSLLFWGSSIIFLISMMILLVFVKFHFDQIYQALNQDSLSQLLQIFNLAHTEPYVRLTLWQNTIKDLIASPMFGYGPGSFAIEPELGLRESYEAHNIFIDIFSEAGIFGVLILLGLLWFILKKCYKNAFMLMSLVALVTFSMFHFTLRQPIFWLCLYWLIVESSTNEKKWNRSAVIFSRPTN